MDRRFLPNVFILTLLLFNVSESYACGPTGRRPIADIYDSYKEAYVGQTVYFDGHLSHDQDEGGWRIIYYQWLWPSGTRNHFGDGKVDAGCQFDSVGEYEVQLMVKDDEYQWSTWPDICTVEVSLADVEFNVEQPAGTYGQVKISYDASNSDASIRSIALKVELSDEATIESEADIVPGSISPAYNCFMDYAFHVIDSSGVYNLGDGHPLAKHDGPGLPDFGSDVSVFSINMACFDEGGQQAPGPVSAEYRIPAGITVYNVSPPTPGHQVPQRIIVPAPADTEWAYLV